MTRNLRPAGLDRLEATLDTYGADRTRWPAPLRHDLSGLIAGNEDARRLLRDASFSIGCSIAHRSTMQPASII